MKCSMNTSILKEDDLPIMVDQLVNTCEGLANLVFTYSDDMTMESSLILLIEGIERFVRAHGTDADMAILKRKCGVLDHLKSVQRGDRYGGAAGGLVPRPISSTALDLIEEEVNVGGSGSD
jgi:hypothetical protein